MTRIKVAVLDDDGVPVPGLAAGDFRVFEDGNEQTLDVVLAPADVPLDVAVVIDFSASISAEWADPQPREAAERFLDALGESDCVYLLPFQDTVGPTTLYVATESGIIPDAPSSIATHSFETPTSGPLAVDSVLKGARVLATRVSETAIAGSTHISEAWLDDYADEVVGW